MPLVLDEKLVAPLLVSVFSLSVAIWSWLMRRWVVRVDALQRSVEDLRLHAAVKDERIGHLTAALDVLRATVGDQAASIGALSAMVHKMWAVLEAQGRVETRHSDDVLGVRRK
jgi:hypothetical protein